MQTPWIIDPVFSSVDGANVEEYEILAGGQALLEIACRDGRYFMWRQRLNAGRWISGQRPARKAVAENENVGVAG